MKAFILEKYGPPETLRIAEVEKPAPAADEVLVKVLAVSVNPADWRSMRAKPFFSRASLGLLRPKHRILGGDIAGRVEAVGSGVHHFKPGDEVYANLLDHGSGGFAEYVSVPVEVMSLKPANLSFEEAAAVPMAAVTALQGLRYHGEIRPQQMVLINGASGGIGTFAVQIAKSCGSWWVGGAAEVVVAGGCGDVNCVGVAEESGIDGGDVPAVEVPPGRIATHNRPRSSGCPFWCGEEAAPPFTSPTGGQDLQVER